MSARWALLLLCGAVAGCGGGGSGKAPTSPNAPTTPTLNADGDAVADSADCAPNDASRWQFLAAQSTDFDGDGRRVSSSGELCSGSSLPTTHFATSIENSEQDCDDTSVSNWRLLPYAARDADADGFSVALTGHLCSGDSLPAGYSELAPQRATIDCDDANAATWRFMTTYQDRDGDGVGSGDGKIVCMGLTLASGTSLYGYDPLDDPQDPNAASTRTFELPVWSLLAR